MQAPAPPPEVSYPPKPPWASVPPLLPSSPLLKPSQLVCAQGAPSQCPSEDNTVLAYSSLANTMWAECPVTTPPTTLQALPRPVAAQTAYEDLGNRVGFIVTRYVYIRHIPACFGQGIGLMTHIARQKNRLASRESPGEGNSRQIRV